MKRTQKIVSQKASGDGIMRTSLQLGLTIIMFVALLGLVSTSALAKGHGWHPRACSKTASAAYLACYNEKKDDYWIAQGNCYNTAEEDQSECFQEAKAEYKDAKGDCQDQLDARKDLCDELGEDPYDPTIKPANFENPDEIGDGVTPNPYFPLVPGSFWKYKTRQDGEVTETNTDEVLTDTKEIMGVECVVVHDIVYKGNSTSDDDIIEDTYDYYAQDVEGNVWYFGEFSLSFEEDLPSMEGSWIFGMDDAKPGIVMFANPLPPGVGEGTVYRQEFLLGDAEDWAQLESLDAEVNVSDHPEFSCAQATDTEPGDNCRGTAEGTPLEPDVIEHKYYKPGIGTVLETAPTETTLDGERTELVSFSSP
jgi:hypothetical protein